MNYILECRSDIDKILDRFNHFHDGFIKRINFESYDYFESHKSQVCLGEFNMNIDFAHNNYNNGLPPFNQIIKACFIGVRDLYFDFQKFKNCDGAIVTVKIENCERKDENNLVQSFFVFKVIFNYYNRENNEWTNAERMSFAFKKANFIESI